MTLHYQYRNHGQAILELLTALLALTMLILGVVFVSGLCLGNLETLLDAKNNAEELASQNQQGYDGEEISTWIYTSYGHNADRATLPFLSGDRPAGGIDLLATADDIYNDAVYSAPENELSNQQPMNSYIFLRPASAPLTNVGATAPKLSESAYLAANLLVGTGSNSADPVLTLRKIKTDQALYRSFSRLLGVNLSSVNLSKLRANLVYYPARQVKTP